MTPTGLVCFDETWLAELPPQLRQDYEYRDPQPVYGL